MKKYRYIYTALLALLLSAAAYAQTQEEQAGAQGTAAETEGAAPVIVVSGSKIDAVLDANRHEERQRVMANQMADYRHPASPPSQFEPKGSDDLYSGSIGLFMPDNSNAQADENYFEEQLKRKNKKKKQRKIRF